MMGLRNSFEAFNDVEHMKDLEEDSNKRMLFSEYAAQAESLT